MKERVPLRIKSILSIVVASTALVCSAVVLSGCKNQAPENGSKDTTSGGEEITKEQAIELAQSAYQSVVEQGIDLSDGPCIADDLAAGWVADIAHDPRQDVDNRPENQCPSYGVSASHFVELDEDGAVIRVR